ncbi:MAG: LytTR family transcriptional regulator [Bacteroidetes bacterium]|nr:LytTR family transcriptional regulator [Bacteroidota bacterium]
MNGNTATRPYKNDTRIFLVVIPIISAINYYLTYNNIRWNSFLLLTFTIDTLQGYAAWWTVRAIINWLDNRIPYSSGISRRIGIQVPITTIAGLAVIIISTEAISWMVKGVPAALNFYTMDVIIIAIWFLVINGIYVGWHFYHQWQVSEWAREEESRKKAGGLIVTQGKQEMIIPFDDLAALCVDADYVVACHRDGRKFYLTQSLDKLEKQLPSSDFFRFNRQYILHRALVSGFNRGDNGKLQVLVMAFGPIPAEITVSRIRAAAFRAWFRP